MLNPAPVGAEDDPRRHIGRRQLDIGDDPVARMGGIDLEMQPAGDLFVTQ